MMLVLVLVLSVLMAIVARFGRLQLPAEKPLDCVPDAPARTGQGLDLVLLEELDRPAPHPAAQHDLRALPGDEIGDLSWAVPGEIRILHHVDVGYVLTFEIDQDEVRAAAEMMADCAFQPTIIIC